MNKPKLTTALPLAATLMVAAGCAPAMQQMMEQAGVEKQGVQEHLSDETRIRTFNCVTSSVQHIAKDLAHSHAQASLAEYLNVSHVSGAAIERFMYDERTGVMCVIASIPRQTQHR